MCRSIRCRGTRWGLPRVRIKRRSSVCSTYSPPGHRQEVRFVRHHQMLIGAQDGFLHRNGRFVGHFAKVMNAQAFPVRQLRAVERTVGIQHPATGDTVKPLFAADGTEVFTQAVRAPSTICLAAGARYWLDARRR